MGENHLPTLGIDKVAAASFDLTFVTLIVSIIAVVLSVVALIINICVNHRLRKELERAKQDHEKSE